MHSYIGVTADTSLAHIDQTWIDVSDSDARRLFKLISSNNGVLTGGVPGALTVNGTYLNGSVSGPTGGGVWNYDDKRKQYRLMASAKDERSAETIKRAFSDQIRAGKDSFLTREVEGIPVYGWGLIGIGGTGILGTVLYFLLRKKR